MAISPLQDTQLVRFIGECRACAGDPRPVSVADLPQPLLVQGYAARHQAAVQRLGPQPTAGEHAEGAGQL